MLNCRSKKALLLLIQISLLGLNSSSSSSLKFSSPKNRFGMDSLTKGPLPDNFQLVVLILSVVLMLSFGWHSIITLDGPFRSKDEYVNFASPCCFWPAKYRLFIGCLCCQKLLNYIDYKKDYQSQYIFESNTTLTSLTYYS